MPKPFVIFSLPRSRSAWLAHFLKRGAKVGHDIGIECNVPSDFIRALAPGMLAGTCETGADFAWPLFQREMPDAKYIVIRRSLDEVVNSLNVIGLNGLDNEMAKREQNLRCISASRTVTTIKFDDLKKPAVLEWLYEYLLDQPLDASWLAQMQDVNIHLDTERRMARLREREPAITQLKETIRKQLAWVH